MARSVCIYLLGRNLLWLQARSNVAHQSSVKGFSDAYMDVRLLSTLFVCPDLGDCLLHGRGEAVSYKLCYVEGSWAWFTTAPLDKQWGDDWNDAPYEHNADRPYEWRDWMEQPKYDLFQVAWDGPLDTPCEGYANSPYSVEMINAGAVAWLRTSSYWSGVHVVIPAGTSLEDFVGKVQESGGQVYLPYNVNAECP